MQREFQSLCHVLRAAILNDKDFGMKREDSASQLNKYDAFFTYDWSVEKLQYSFEHARKAFGKIET